MSEEDITDIDDDISEGKIGTMNEHIEPKNKDLKRMHVASIINKNIDSQEKSSPYKTLSLAMERLLLSENRPSINNNKSQLVDVHKVIDSFKESSRLKSIIPQHHNTE